MSDSDTNQVSSNVRLRFTHRPLCDIFVVDNEQRDVRRGGNDRMLTLKFTHRLGL